MQIVVRKGIGNFDINLCPIEESNNTEFQKNIVKIPCHKLVLSARCPYFFAQFCKSEWGDKNQSEAKFTQFSEEPMREFLKYLYTGKIKLDIGHIMGILRIASFFGMEDLIDACKG